MSDSSERPTEAIITTKDENHGPSRSGEPSGRPSSASEKDSQPVNSCLLKDAEEVAMDQLRKGTALDWLPDIALVNVQLGAANAVSITPAAPVLASPSSPHVSDVEMLSSDFEDDPTSEVQVSPVFTLSNASLSGVESTFPDMPATDQGDWRL